MNKELYFKEVGEILKQTKDLDKSDFQLLFDAVTEKDKKIDSEFLADSIVKKLSWNMFSGTIIAWSFLETEIGRALIKAKFDLSNNIYLVSDLTQITGYTKVFISQEYKNGNIKGEKRGGTLLFTEKDVREYLSKKGINSLNERKNILYEETKEKLISSGFEREENYK